MSKRMSVAVMAVAVLVFIAACGSNATPMPTPASPTATHTPLAATPTVSDPDLVQATLLRYQDRWQRSGHHGLRIHGRVVLLLPPGVSCRGGSYRTWRGCHER